MQFVASGSRMRLYLPKDTCLITFMIAGKCVYLCIVTRGNSGNRFYNTLKRTYAGITPTSVLMRQAGKHFVAL